MDQCVEEVEAEPDGDDQSDDRFTHRRRLLKLTQGERVAAHQRQSRQTERHECDVEHVRLLAGVLLSAESRKLSIANWAAARKDLISFRPAVMEQGPIWRADVAGDKIPAEAKRSEGPAVAGAETVRDRCSHRKYHLYYVYHGRSTYSSMLMPGKMW